MKEVKINAQDFMTNSDIETIVRDFFQAKCDARSAIEELEDLTILQKLEILKENNLYGIERGVPNCLFPKEWYEELADKDQSFSLIEDMIMLESYEAGSDKGVIFFDDLVNDIQEDNDSDQPILVIQDLKTLKKVFKKPSEVINAIWSYAKKRKFCGFEVCH